MLAGGCAARQHTRLAWCGSRRAFRRPNQGRRRVESLPIDHRPPPHRGIAVSGLCSLTGGRAGYTNDLIRTYYESAPERQVMGLHVSLGVARDFSGEPHALVLWLPEPVRIGDELHDRLDLELYAFAPETAPAGKTAVKAHFSASYAYWRGLRDQGAAYEEEEQRIAETVIEQLDRRFPGLKAQVEVVDVATPLTTERYVGSYRGLQAWPVPNQSPMDALSGKGLSRTLPGLEGFYMAGQWAGGLGLPTVAAMGRKTIEAICKKDGRRFVTSQ